MSGGLFDIDPVGGAVLRDEAMARAEVGAAADWRAAADAAVRELSAGWAPFTSDDVRDKIPPGVETPEPRALGPVMRNAVRLGLCTPYGWTTEGRPEAHARPRRTYVGTGRA